MGNKFAVVDNQVRMGKALGLPKIDRQAMVGFYVKPTMEMIQAVKQAMATGQFPSEAIPEVPEMARKLSADAIVESARSWMNDEEFEAFSLTFEREYREAWMKYTARNPGAVMYAQNYMAHSEVIMPFWKDILDGKIGRASMAPYFVLRGFDGRFHVVEPHDAAFHTCLLDANFVAMRRRSQLEFEQILELSRSGGGSVLMLGGGCAPVTWAYGKLPDNVNLTVVDSVDYEEDLKELLGVEELSEAHIRYVVGDFMAATRDTLGLHDIVIVDGVLAYYHGQEEVLLMHAYDFCHANSKMLCDLQVKVVEDALDVMILGWPQTMFVYETKEEAMNAMAEICQNLGLTIKDSVYPECGSVAGVAFIL